MQDLEYALRALYASVPPTDEREALDEGFTIVEDLGERIPDVRYFQRQKGEEPRRTARRLARSRHGESRAYFARNVSTNDLGFAQMGDDFDQEAQEAQLTRTDKGAAEWEPEATWVVRDIERPLYERD